ncbi:oligogalacturonate-specific porin KdgM family protein [Providencia hangzhouensis]|uniref:oligogalacturonate-specific porin KdgM family protein n=1 Tax=Providencia hangzhouensis TaxID=3031799 RepID=UPI0034DCCA9C
MFNNKILLACCTFFISFQLNATTLDFRHEYSDSSRINKNCIAFIHSFSNGIGFYIDASIKSGGVDGEKDKVFSDVVNNAIEMGLSYNHKINKSITLQPGLIFETVTDTSIYKPYLKAQYNFDNGLYIAGRYRFDYARKTKKAVDDEKTNRFDAFIGYKYNKYKIEYDYTQMYSDGIKYDNKKRNYEHNVSFSYQLSDTFTPYIEVGNVAVSPTSDARQTRYRLGLQFHF